VKRDLLENFLGGALLGLFALALDYFVLQHFLASPVSRAGGVTIVVMLLYLIVPFLILQFARGDNSAGGRNG
jgi:hypothetical protein